MKICWGNPVEDGINDLVNAIRLCFLSLGPLGFGFQYGLPIYNNGGVEIPLLNDAQT